MQRVAILLLFLFCRAVSAAEVLPAFTKPQTEKVFDQIWTAFDADYAMFTLRPEVDWNALRDQFRPKAIEAKSASEFAGTIADMLRPLRDLHVWVRVGTNDISVFNRPRAFNANPAALRVLLPPLQSAGNDIQWTVTPENVGFVSIRRWADPEAPTEFNKLLEEMRNTRGLIIDVRRNGGGGEPLAREIAGRFLERQFVYAFSQIRNGPSHADLGPKQPRRAQPRGPWRYDRPVVLLIGQRCLSSNESFVAMMTGAPNVTTMGDHTGGSSGNPKMLSLPFEMSVSVPRWIDYLPDGTLLDEHGVKPQIQFAAEPGAFEGERDDLLLAALERLRQAPLPKDPIAGPAFMADGDQPRAFTRLPQPDSDFSAILKEEANDAARPHVVSVSPPDGAENVVGATELRIRFDRAMDPMALQLEWLSGGFLNPVASTYDAEKHEFILPLELLPGSRHQIALNKDFFGAERIIAHPGEGFRAANGARAAVFVWSFRTTNAPVFPKAVRPKAIRISPSNNGGAAPAFSFFDVEFDQEMLPPEKAFPYVVQWPLSNLMRLPDLISVVDYDATRRIFHLPIVFAPKNKVSFALAGFRGTNGALCEALKLEFASNGELAEAGERKKTESAARDAKLLDLLTQMQRVRARIDSISERVQTTHLYQEDGVFTRLMTTGSEFKWRSPHEFYADVSMAMHTPEIFRIGNDGERWWFRVQNNRTNFLEICKTNEMHEADVSICDPFELTRKTPAQAVHDLQLDYTGLRTVSERQFHVVERWDIQPNEDFKPSVLRIQWWIDAKTLRPSEAVQFGSSYVSRLVFFYDAVNEMKASESFAPKVSGDVVSRAPAPLDEKFTNRFVILHDGSDGMMRVRWGRAGPNARNSSGLN